MTASTAPHDEPYHELVDYSWTEKAFEMLERADLHGEAVSRNGVVGSRVWGPCPRCGHELDDKQTHTAITNLALPRKVKRAGTMNSTQPRLASNAQRAGPGRPKPVPPVQPTLQPSTWTLTDAGALSRTRRQRIWRTLLAPSANL